MSEEFDIAIIGAGPGGFAAAAADAKNKIPHMLFEKEELGNTTYNYQLRKHVMDEPGRLPLRGEIPFTASSREQVLEGWASLEWGSLLLESAKTTDAAMSPTATALE